LYRRYGGGVKPRHIYYGLALGMSFSLVYIVLERVVRLRYGTTEVANRLVAVIDVLYWIALGAFMVFM
jgi:hypothetical protein